MQMKLLWLQRKLATRFKNLDTVFKISTASKVHWSLTNWPSWKITHKYERTQIYITSNSCCNRCIRFFSLTSTPQIPKLHPFSQPPPPVKGPATKDSDKKILLHCKFTRIYKGHIANKAFKRHLKTHNILFKKIKTLENFRRRKLNHLRWLNTVLRVVSGNSRDSGCFKLDKQTGQWYTEDDFSKSTHWIFVIFGRIFIFIVF